VYEARSDEVAVLLRRIGERSAAGKVTRLRPESALLCQIALRALLIKPTREELMVLICGSRKCSYRRDCFTCYGKATPSYGFTRATVRCSLADNQDV
jgi:hypothetical protein